jgi:uncharacterized protein YabE (DUF348 family)
MLKVFFKKATIQKYIMPFAVVIVIVFLLTAMYMKRKTITVIVNGEQRKIITYRNTVAQVLKTNDISIGPKDKINSSLDSKLSDNQSIVIKKAVNVKVTVDGTYISLLSSEDNIGSMLLAEGIALRDNDKVVPDKSASLTEGMNVKVVRIDIKAITEVVPIQFKEVVKVNKSLANTKKQISQEGKNGEKEIKTQITYEDGKEVSREVISETIIKNARDKIIVQGTYPYMPVSRSGSIMSYSRVFEAKATAYWAVNGIGRTYTASGRKAVWNPDGYSTIAVDRRVIPYGTKLFIEGYGFAIAADTGSSIIGNKIDLYFNTIQQARSWGAKYVKVYVLK